MSKLNSISIADPCSKNWDHMKVTHDGRHCDSCAKNVIDFSVMSNDAIIDYLKKYRYNQICGRFFVNQIHTIRVELEEQLLYTKIAQWKKFLIIFLVCFGFELFSVKFVLAQANNIDTLEVTLDTAPAIKVDTNEVKNEKAVEKTQHVKKSKIKEELILNFEIKCVIMGALTLEKDIIDEDLSAKTPVLKSSKECPMISAMNNFENHPDKTPDRIPSNENKMLLVSSDVHSRRRKTIKPT